jgi:hypothetical protein
MSRYTDDDFTNMLANVRVLAEDEADGHFALWAAEGRDEDSVPYPDLSGEWADAWTPKKLAESVGLYHYQGGMLYDLTESEFDDYCIKLDTLCDEYEETYRERISHLFEVNPVTPEV